MAQRVAVAISCLIFYRLVKTDTTSSAVEYSALAVLSALACIEKLGAIMNLVAVERDWVVVIASDDEAYLSGEI